VAYIYEGARLLRNTFFMSPSKGMCDYVNSLSRFVADAPIIDLNSLPICLSNYCEYLKITSKIPCPIFYWNNLQIKKQQLGLLPDGQA